MPTTPVPQITPMSFFTPSSEPLSMVMKLLALSSDELTTLAGMVCSPAMTFFCIFSTREESRVAVRSFSLSCSTSRSR